MNEICKAIASWCRKNQAIEDGQYNIVVYGLNVLLDSSIKILGIFLISILLHCFYKCLIVLAVFCSMRHWIGGYHCRTHFGCFSAMLFISLIPCILMNLPILFFARMSIMAGMLLYSVYAVLRYAPMNSKVNPIADEGILRRKRIMGIVECAVITAAVICCRHNNICWLLGTPLFIEAVTISPLWNRGGG